MMRRTLLSAAATALLALAPTAAFAAPGGNGNGAGGVTGAGIYVHGEEYRTVGTPTDFSDTGAPESTYDLIYDLGGEQDHNVAEAAPGDPGFNGGRWKVHAVTFTNYEAALMTYDANMSGDFDSVEEVEAAIAGGAATDEGIVKSFLCPVIPVPGR